MSMWNNIICLGCLSGWGWFLLPSRFLMSTLTSLQRFTMAQIRVRQKKTSTWCEIRKGTCYSWPLQQTCRIDPVGVFMFRTCFGEKKVLKKYPSKTSPKKKRNTFKTSQLPCLTVTHPNSPFFPTLLSRRRVRLTWSMIWSSGSGWCKWPRRNPSSRLALSGLEAVNWKNGFVREVGHLISFYTFYTLKSSNMAIEKWWLQRLLSSSEW